MKIVPGTQGSEAWHKARLGIPTASAMHRICTPLGKPSEGQTRYIADLLAEWFFQSGSGGGDGDHGFMVRGTAIEPRAIAWLALTLDTDIDPVGLCVTDDGRAGASPDGLIGTDGTAEIKAPGAETMMLYWLAGRPKDHKVQRQGQLWVTARAYSVLGIYHPTVPELRTVAEDERDEDFIGTLAEQVTKFCDRLDDAKARLAGARAQYLQRVEDEIPAMLS